MMNYEELTNQLLQRRDQYLSEQKIKKYKIIHTASAFCVICFAALLCIGIFRQVNLTVAPQDQTVDDALIPGIKDTVDDKNGESLTGSIIFNSVEVPRMGSDVPFFGIMGICLYIDDFFPMTLNEMYDYYGVDYTPTVPLDLQFVEGRTHGIYRRNGGDVYFDADALTYTNGDQTRTVFLQVNKVGGISSVIPFAEGVKELSLIHNVEVFLGQGTSNEYCAEFSFNNVNYFLFSVGISETEFVSVVESILRK